MSQLNVENITNRDGAGAPNFPKGAVVAGVITATTFKGDGSELEGIVGFATAVSEDTTHFASDFYTATHSRQVPANTQYTVQGNANAGNVVFTKLGQIHVAAGATFHVANGTTFSMDSLNIFD